MTDLDRAARDFFRVYLVVAFAVYGMIYLHVWYY